MDAMQTENAQVKPLHVRFRDERKRQKLTQREVSTKANIGLRTYQNFETSGKALQPNNLEAVGWALGLNVDGTSRALHVVPSDQEDREPTPADVQIFVDMVVGMLLAWPGDDNDRLELEREATRWFFNRRRDWFFQPEE